MLIGIAGRGWYQEEGKAAVEILPGTVIHIPADKMLELIGRDLSQTFESGDLRILPGSGYGSQAFLL